MGPWVEELARFCNELPCSPDCLCLDLAAVTFIDWAGVELLRGLIGRGVRLAACSRLAAELLHVDGKLRTNAIGSANRATREPAAERRSDMASDEGRLLERVRAGDEQACEALVRQHSGRMFAVARRLLQRDEDSADAVQDAFLSAFRSLHTFQGNSTLGTWLHRIVVNVCLMKLRSRSRCREVRIEDLLPTFDETGHHSNPVRAWDDAALARLTRAETQAHVRACIDRLPDPYREVLVLRDMEDMDTEQTAGLLGITAGAVKTRLHRARQALRTLLEPVVLGEGGV